MDWKTINIFISSSFNDMHAERDYLVEYVFPELREWCEKRHLYLNDIDLRWGVTTQDSNNMHTIRVCLKRVDECRPFFLCFLGQRRGTIFGREKISDETFTEFPELETLAEKNSATELEIEHALLAPMLTILNGKKVRPEKARRALFFLRENPFDGVILSETHKKIYTNAAADDPEEAERKHTEFRMLVKKSCPNVKSYQCRFDLDKITPELSGYGIEDGQPSPHAERGRLTDFTADSMALKDVIIQQLQKMILEEYPDRKDGVDDNSSSEKDVQFMAQGRFMQFYINRKNDFDKLNGYVYSNSTGVFVLSSESGAGKSTLLANFANKVVDRHVIIRFCSVSQNSTRFTDVLRGIFTDEGLTVPDDDKSLIEGLSGFLSDLCKERKILLIIDDITRTAEGIGALKMLPQRLPGNLKLIVSLRETHVNSQLIKEISDSLGAVLYHLSPFSTDEKKQLIRNYLDHNLKNLDEEHIQYICSLPHTNNPLYLKVILKELRTFGSFDDLRLELKSFGETPEEAFAHILDRLEQKVSEHFGKIRGCTEYLLGLLSYSKTGITKSDIRKLIERKYEKSCNACVEYIIRCLRDYLSGDIFVNSLGKVDFLYDSLKRAAAKRYSENEDALRTALASVFYISDPEECSYQLRTANQTDKLKALYNDPAFLCRFCEISGGWKLLREVDILGGEIVGKNVSDCLHTCAQALTSYPKKAPQIFYKEIWNKQFRQNAKSLIKDSWLRFEPIAADNEEPTADGNGDDLVPYLENRYLIKSSVFAKCFSETADLAFIMMKADVISVFCMSTAELLYEIPIDENTPGKILSSGDGRYLAIVSSDFDISVYELIRSGKDFLLKSLLREDCARIRFKGACAYAVNDAIIWQTKDKALRVFKNGRAGDLSRKDGDFAGAWNFDTLLLLFKDASGYTLYGGNASLKLKASVNDIVLWNGCLYAAVKDSVLYVLDPVSLDVKNTIKTCNPLYSFAPHKAGLLATDEEYQLELITDNGRVSDLGCINFSNGNVNTNAFEHIKACPDGVFYSSDSVCAKLKLKAGSVSEQAHPLERHFNAVKEEDRKKVYDTFEGQCKECIADGITYKLEDRNTLSSYSADGRKIGSALLDESLSGNHILKTSGKKAVVLTVRAKKKAGLFHSSVVRSVIAVFNGSSLLFRKEYEPNDNIIDVYVDGERLWVRGNVFFRVIDCQNRFSEKMISFDFSGFNRNSPAAVINSYPIMFRSDTYELCVFSGENGKLLASFPMSRAIKSIQRGENGALCQVIEYGNRTYNIYLEVAK